MYTVCMTANETIYRPVQELLFPFDEDEQFLIQRTVGYKSLPEPAQRIVCAHIKIFRQTGREAKPVQIIEASGLPKSTYYEVVQANSVEIDAVLSDASRYLGDRALKLGAIGLPLAAALITSRLISGFLDPLSLEPHHIRLLERAGESCGQLRMPTKVSGASVTSPDGHTISAWSGEVGEEPSAAQAVVLEMLRGQRRTVAGSAAARGPESVRPAALPPASVPSAPAPAPEGTLHPAVPAAVDPDAVRLPPSGSAETTSAPTPVDSAAPAVQIPPAGPAGGAGAAVPDGGER